ncbi:MAG: sulfite exporter TauE/SafE family protein, partial [Actinomycetota bacterium]|nr:sulfite exporter TauE/SafE family protein [Actinomycetota bacterium]
ILTVPALVYLLGQSAQDAITSSLVIVGLTALVGVASHARSGHVHWRIGIPFGVLGIIAAVAGTALNRRVDEHVLLLGLSAVMILTASGMLIRARRNAQGHDGHLRPTTTTGADTTKRVPDRAPGAAPTAQLARPATHRGQRRRGRTVLVVKVMLAGLTVGFLAGFFGVGGGFVIVPVLVVALGLPMSAAVGTSLAIMAINSAASLAARIGQAHFDWALIVPFAIAAMAGSLAGKVIADRLPDTALNRAFAALLIAVAAYIAINSALSLS